MAFIRHALALLGMRLELRPLRLGLRTHTRSLRPHTPELRHVAAQDQVVDKPNEKEENSPGADP